jgi:hypothetical protein
MIRCDLWRSRTPAQQANSKQQTTANTMQASLAIKTPATSEWSNPIDEGNALFASPVMSASSIRTDGENESPTRDRRILPLK